MKFSYSLRYFFVVNFREFMVSNTIQRKTTFLLGSTRKMKVRSNMQIKHIKVISNHHSLTFN